MDKFKKGDRVMISKKSSFYSYKCRKDSSNPANIGGTITTIDNGYGHLNIEVDWDNKTHNSYSEIDLILLKQTQMARRKRTTAAATSPCEIELTDGMYFKATYKKPGSRTTPIEIRGVVQEVDTGEFDLCNRFIGDNADEPEYNNGFQKEYRVEMEAGRSVTKQLAEHGITNFTQLTDARQKAVVDKDKTPTIGDWTIRKDEDGSYVVGCGDVTVSPSEMKAVIKAMKALTPAEFSDFVDVCDQAKEASQSVNDVEIKDVLKAVEQLG